MTRLILIYELEDLLFVCKERWPCTIEVTFLSVRLNFIFSKPYKIELFVSISSIMVILRGIGEVGNVTLRGNIFGLT